jgi:hypothetical protein
MAVALISTLTGRCFVMYREIVSRAEGPKTFWQTIAMNCLLGLFLPWTLLVYAQLDFKLRHSPLWGPR